MVWIVQGTWPDDLWSPSNLDYSVMLWHSYIFSDLLTCKCYMCLEIIWWIPVLYQPLQTKILHPQKKCSFTRAFSEWSDSWNEAARHNLCHEANTDAQVWGQMRTATASLCSHGLGWSLLRFFWEYFIQNWITFNVLYWTLVLYLSKC